MSLDGLSSRARERGALQESGQDPEDYVIYFNGRSRSGRVLNLNFNVNAVNKLGDRIVGSPDDGLRQDTEPLERVETVDRRTTCNTVKGRYRPLTVKISIDLPLR